MQQASMDWMLKDLAEGIPETRHVLVLSSDGLCMAQYGTDTDTADRLAAACAGLQSLARAVATELPHGDGRMRLVVIEMSGGFFYLMAAGARAYLAVLADEGVDAGLMGQGMRDLVARIGEHLTTPPRQGRAGRMSGTDHSWGQDRPERLYVITGGRSALRAQAAPGRPALDLVTLVVACAEPRPSMPPEATAILRMCSSPLSVAEISAYLGLPVSVTVVLLADLLEGKQVEARSPVPRPSFLTVR
ncbi:DUF742 domain-containing protein [Streptacidiphilus sp. 4-A2]|nr:DUF742 domain-containing protein [Streptacidiphilus sp. 4-A2]